MCLWAAEGGGREGAAGQKGETGYCANKLPTCWNAGNPLVFAHRFIFFSIFFFFVSFFHIALLGAKQMCIIFQLSCVLICFLFSYCCLQFLFDPRIGNSFCKDEQEVEGKEVVGEVFYR